MKLGKVSESVLKRSVLKPLRFKRPDVITGAGIGRDFASINPEEGKTIIMSTDTVSLPVEDIEYYALHSVLNDLAASGGEPTCIMMNLMLPPSVMESDLKAIMTRLHLTCAEYGVQVTGGHTEVTNAVTRPVITITGMGKVDHNKLLNIADIRPGMDIVMSKSIGIEATAIIAKEKADELSARFSPGFIQGAATFMNQLSVLPEASYAAEYGVSGMHDVSGGGMFGALWEVAEAAGSGLEVDLRNITVRQETIELCEFYDLNPYQMKSGGCLLMVVNHGHGLADFLQKKGIHASVIGKMTEGNDRVILNDGEKRYLEPPKQDELVKIFG